MKHPGPWENQLEPWELEHEPLAVNLKDPGGFDLFAWDEDGTSFSDHEAKRLIQAAPVLLEALAVAVSENCPREITPFNLLVGWLNGEPGYPEVNLDEFLKWLRRERVTLTITRDPPPDPLAAVREHVEREPFVVPPLAAAVRVSEAWFAKLRELVGAKR